MSKRTIRRWAQQQYNQEAEPWPLWVRLLVLAVIAAAVALVIANGGSV